MTLVAERSQPIVESDGGSFENHILLKTDILEGIINGTEATALCGDKFVPESRGAGVTNVSTAKVCPQCMAQYRRKLILEGLTGRNR